MRGAECDERVIGGRKCLGQAGEIHLVDLQFRVRFDSLRRAAGQDMHEAVILVGQQLVKQCAPHQARGAGEEGGARCVHEADFTPRVRAISRLLIQVDTLQRQCIYSLIQASISGKFRCRNPLHSDFKCGAIAWPCEFPLQLPEPRGSPQASLLRFQWKKWAFQSFLWGAAT